jgi:hypothetical protein
VVDLPLESSEEKAKRLRGEMPKPTLNASTTRADDAYDNVKGTVRRVKEYADNAEAYQEDIPAGGRNSFEGTTWKATRASESP